MPNAREKPWSDLHNGDIEMSACDSNKIVYFKITSP